MEHITMTNFAQVLSGQSHYCVPDYQRGYIWTEKNWEDMWNDLKDLLARRDKIHFTGLAVFRSKDTPANTSSIVDGQQRSSIVDGQQRLITYSLMICAIVDRASCDVLSTRAKDILQTPQGEIRLQCKDGEDRNQFDAIIQNTLQLCKHESKHESEIPDGVMKKAYEFFQMKANEVKSSSSEEDLKVHFDTLSQRFTVGTVYLGAKDVDAPHYFDCLNNRGHQLTAFDQLRNNVFLRAGSSASKLYRAHWKHLDDDDWWTVERQNELLEMFLHVRAATSKMSMPLSSGDKSDLFDVYRRNFGGKNVKQELCEFSSSSKLYKTHRKDYGGPLHFFSFLEHKHPEVASRLFRAWLPVVLHVSGYPCASRRESLLGLIEQFLLFCGLTYGLESITSPRFTFDLIKDMANQEDLDESALRLILEHCKPKFPTREVVENGLRRWNINDQVEERKRLVLYILYRIDLALAKCTSLHIENDVSLGYHWGAYSRPGVPRVNEAEHERIGAFSIYDAAGKNIFEPIKKPATVEGVNKALWRRKEAVITQFFELWP